MKDIFGRAFSKEALRNPGRRPKEGDWLRELALFRSEIVTCRHCGNEVFLEGVDSGECDRCHERLKARLRFDVVFPGRSEPLVPIVRDARIYACQLGLRGDVRPLDRVVQVVASKNNPGMLGIVNTRQTPIEARHNRNARIRVAVLEFNNSSRWVTSYGPEYLEYFVWDDLEANGLTAVGDALDALNEKLTTTDRGGYIDTSHGALVPAFIFMTDGFATDEYQKALERIRQNKWFNRGTRVGFAIGKNPDVEIGGCFRALEANRSVPRSRCLQARSYLQIDTFCYSLSD